MPGGALSIKYGSKIVIGVAILTGSILTMLIPLLSEISYVALIICRFLIGLAHVFAIFCYVSFACLKINLNLIKNADFVSDIDALKKFFKFVFNFFYF